MGGRSGVIIIFFFFFFFFFYQKYSWHTALVSLIEGTGRAASLVIVVLFLCRGSWRGGDGGLLRDRCSALILIAFPLNLIFVQALASCSDIQGKTLAQVNDVYARARTSARYSKTASCFLLLLLLLLLFFFSFSLVCVCVCVCLCVCVSLCVCVCVSGGGGGCWVFFVCFVFVIFVGN